MASVARPDANQAPAYTTPPNPDCIYALSTVAIAYSLHINVHCWVAISCGLKRFQLLLHRHAACNLLRPMFSNAMAMLAARQCAFLKMHPAKLRSAEFLQYSEAAILMLCETTMLVSISCVGCQATVCMLLYVHCSQHQKGTRLS